MPSDRFELSSGADQLRWYRSSECIEWGFCATCGSSALYRAVRAGHAESPKLDRIYVTAASLTEIDRAPQAHVSYEEHVPWCPMRDGLPKHRGKTDEQLAE